MTDSYIRKLEALVRDLRGALSHVDDASYVESRIRRIASDMESELRKLKAALTK